MAKWTFLLTVAAAVVCIALGNHHLESSTVSAKVPVLGNVSGNPLGIISGGKLTNTESCGTAFNPAGPAAYCNTTVEAQQKRVVVAGGIAAVSLALTLLVLVLRVFTGGARAMGRIARRRRGGTDPVSTSNVKGAPGDGWFPDPMRRHEERYWDGSQWSPHVRDSGRPSFDQI
jgi:hypothetical protein